LWISLIRGQAPLEITELSLRQRELICFGCDAVPDFLNQVDTFCNRELIDSQGL
jgi:hypothetical protein